VESVWLVLIILMSLNLHIIELGGCDTDVQHDVLTALC
jgi:hypothetical protein